jgi:hypothetical protein
VTYTLYTQLQRARERWDLYTELDNIVPKTSRIASFRDIRYVVYVNLAHRTDRKAETEEELRRMGWNPIRIDAVRYTPGAYGCTKSHIKAIEYAKQRQWSHVLICEDDVHFQRSPAEIRVQLDTFFQHHPKKNDWDVVMLGGESFHMQSMGSGIVRVQSASLSHCYLIRAEYYDVLLSNLHRSLGRYPMDLFWGALQKRDMWLMPIPLIATQRTSYSDLQHRVTEHVDRVSDQVTG